jgi:hypothetical protein
MFDEQYGTVMVHMISENCLFILRFEKDARSNIRSMETLPFSVTYIIGLSYFFAM